MARNDGYSYSCFSKFIRKVLIEHLNVKSEVKKCRDYSSSCIIQTLANRNYTSNTPKLVSKHTLQLPHCQSLFFINTSSIYIYIPNKRVHITIHHMCYLYEISLHPPHH